MYAEMYICNKLIIKLYIQKKVAIFKGCISELYAETFCKLLCMFQYYSWTVTHLVCSSAKWNSEYYLQLDERKYLIITVTLENNKADFENPI
jgi:hypothetical protein